MGLSVHYFQRAIKLMSGTSTVCLNNLPGVCFDVDIWQHLQQDSEDTP